jgi:hypothetical protein
VATILILCGQPKVLEYVNELSMPPDPVSRPGGSSMESMVRLVEKTNMVTPIGETPVVRAAQFVDNYVLRYVFKAISSILPDLQTYDRTFFVAEGFAIPGSEIVAAAIRLLLYVFPFLLIGYYLLNGREIAN